MRPGQRQVSRSVRVQSTRTATTQGKQRVPTASQQWPALGAQLRHSLVPPRRPTKQFAPPSRHALHGRATVAVVRATRVLRGRRPGTAVAAHLRSARNVGGAAVGCAAAGRWRQGLQGRHGQGRVRAAAAVGARTAVSGGEGVGRQVVVAHHHRAAAVLVHHRRAGPALQHVHRRAQHQRVVRQVPAKGGIRGGMGWVLLGGEIVRCYVSGASILSSSY